MAIWKWYIDAEVNMSSVRKETSKLKKELKKSWNYIEKDFWKKGSKAVNGLTVSFKRLWWIIAWVFATVWISKFLWWVAKLWSELEQAQISFETLLWSSEQAIEHLQKIDEFASKTPFNKLWLIKTNQQLLWFWFNAERSLATMQVLGDSISAVWRWDEDLKWVVLALWQIKAKGKLSTEEMLQMAERWLPVFEVLQKELGLTKNEMWNLWNAWIDSATAINALLVWLNKKYAWSMEKQSKTLWGMWSNLVDGVEIAMWKMWLNISKSLKLVVWAINDFMSENMWAIIEFGSDIITFIIDTWKTLFNVISFTISTISDMLWGLLWEQNKTAWDSMNIWKKFFFFIGLWIQSVFLLLNTFVWTLWWAIKSVASWLWAFVEWIWLYMQDFWKNMANWIINKANFLIKWFNVIAKAIWKEWIKEFKTFDTALEKSWWLRTNVWKKASSSWMKSFKKMWDSNKNIMWNMINSINEYETESVSWWKNVLWVFEQNANYLDKIDGKYNNTWKSSSKSNKTQTKWAIETKNKLTELKNEYSKVEKQIQELDKASEDYAKNSKKYNSDIIESVRKLNKELRDKKTKLSNDISNIELESKNKLTDRYVEIKQREKKVKKEIQNINNEDILTTENLQKRIELEKELKKLENEKNSISSNVSKDALTEAQRVAWLNQTQLILEQEKIKKEQAQKDFDREQAKLDSLLKINSAFYNIKKLDQISLDEFKQAETFKNWSVEEQELFLKLAREKVSLTDQANYKMDLEKQISDEVINLSNLSLNAQLENNNTLSKSYDDIIAKIRRAIIKQRELNALWWNAWYKDWGYTGYSSGGFTWSGDNDKVAGVVHAGEWVAPAWMLDSLWPVFDKLETMRNWGSTTKTINKTQNNNITVNSQFEAENFLDYANWKL